MRKKGKMQKKKKVQNISKQSDRKMCKPDVAQIDLAVAESRANYNKQLDAVFLVLVKQFVAMKIETFVITTGVRFESERAYWPDCYAGDQYSNKWLRPRRLQNGAVLASPACNTKLSVVEKPLLNAEMDVLMVRKLLDNQCFDRSIMQASMKDLLHKIRVVWPKEDEISLKKKSKTLPPLVPLSTISKSIADKIGTNSAISSNRDTACLHVDKSDSGAGVGENGDEKSVLKTVIKTKPATKKKKKESHLTFSCVLCGINIHASKFRSHLTTCFQKKSNQ